MIMMMTDSLSIHGNIKFYMCKHAFFFQEILYHRFNFDNLFQSFIYLWKNDLHFNVEYIFIFSMCFFKNRNKLLQFNSSIFSIAYHEMIKALVITTAGNPGLSGIHYQAGLARSCCYH